MADWDSLRRELDLWGEAGRRATLWWRDDDAGPDDGRLAGPHALRRALGVPLALAVVPAWLTETSAALLRGDPGSAVLQHGWDHGNRAGPSRRKRELAAEAPADELDACLAKGQSRLARAFGARFHAAMVPPWNRIDDDVLSRLAARGFVGLSTLGPRAAPWTAGLAVANVHVDIVGWKQGGGFAGEAPVLAAACDHLAGRRQGTVDAEEPTGLMTHHRVHDAACDAFVERFVAATRDHGAAIWLDAGHVFSGIA